MSLEVIEVETAPNPTASIVILHGLGADANDFVPFATELDLASVGPVRFVFPHGPTRPVTINGGYVMRAWYDILGADLGLDGRKLEDEAGLRESQREVEALIAKERARGVAASRIVLGGFSQGCAMTFMAGLRHGERLAGLLCMSGYLPLAPLTATERSAANADVPIFQAHGSADSVIPIARAMESRDALIAFGYPVEWHAYPMPHSVCPQEIADMNRWLLRVLG
ncbi:MAG: alpha/beta hydrolase [Burkholderiaceae bacterium]